MFYKLPDVEIYVSEKMADIRRDVEQRNYIREIEQVNSPVPGWVASQMHRLSVWMIRTGERLHKRYHAPAHMSYLYPGCPQSQ